MNRPQAELDLNESLADALRDAVKALGGAKKVGVQLRPEKTADEAGRWVLDCLNADRPEHFYPEQVLWLMCEARRIGCHAVMSFLARSAGYSEPQPVEPEDEIARLQRAFIESVAQQRQIADRIEKMTRTPIAAVKTA